MGGRHEGGHDGEKVTGELAGINPQLLPAWAEGGCHSPFSTGSSAAASRAPPALRE